MANVILNWRNKISTKVKGWRPELKEALSDALLHWHKEYLPIHFEIRAYRRYPGVYKKRFEKLKGAERRRNKKGQDAKRLRRPMVTTGVMRRNALWRKRLTGTSKGMTLRLPGTQVANFHTGKNPKTGGYNFREEVISFTKGERDTLERIVARRMTAFLRKQHAPIREKK